jgi:hypothetical protein
MSDIKSRKLRLPSWVRGRNDMAEGCLNRFFRVDKWSLCQS